MAVIEGHAEHVMDAVAPDLLPSLPKLRAALDRRRRSQSGSRGWWRSCSASSSSSASTSRASSSATRSCASVDRGAPPSVFLADALPTLAELRDPTPGSSGRCRRELRESRSSSPDAAAYAGSVHDSFHMRVAVTPLTFRCTNTCSSHPERSKRSSKDYSTDSPRHAKTSTTPRRSNHHPTQAGQRRHGDHAQRRSEHEPHRRWHAADNAAQRPRPSPRPGAPRRRSSPSGRSSFRWARACWRATTWSRPSRGWRPSTAPALNLERELKRYERRGATARNRFERQVRRARTRFERELRQRRSLVEKTMRQNRRRLDREISSVRKDFEKQSDAVGARVERLVSSAQGIIGS